MGSLEGRVKGLVVEILTSVQTNLEAEQHGIALEVMRAVMEFGITGIAGKNCPVDRSRNWSRPFC